MKQCGREFRNPTSNHSGVLQSQFKTHFGSVWRIETLSCLSSHRNHPLPVNFPSGKACSDSHDVNLKPQESSVFNSFFKCFIILNFSSRKALNTRVRRDYRRKSSLVFDNILAKSCKLELLNLWIKREAAHTQFSTEGHISPKPPLCQ